MRVESETSKFGNTIPAVIPSIPRKKARAMTLSDRTKGRVLVVDDDQTMCELVELAVKKLGYETAAFTHPTDALDALGTQEFDAVLSDVGMGEMNGFAFCERVLGIRPGLPVVMLTGQTSLDTAVAAMRAGAYDFLTKPVDALLLSISLQRAAAHRKLQREVSLLRAAATNPKASIVGTSSAMKRVYDLIDRVAASEASVLVFGQTGTGKELIARAIHEQSPRASKPFVAINCAAVPASLIESELFGHAKGAFTDAKADRKGLFQLAQGGTLFLDEIGELPIDMQPKLLRALQERKVRPVGSNTEIPFDARIVSATNRNLEDEVFHKRFREDLFYRLNVVQLDLPALRSRGRDVLELAQHFLVQFSTRSGRERPLLLSHAAAEKLMAYEWPGNVRELENSMERAVALARLDEVAVDDLPERVRAYQTTHFTVPVDDTAEMITLDELERKYITRVLKLVGDNKTRAAQILGVDRRTLYRKLGRTDGDAEL
jgi:DNA-binding NtrC family response regulator